MFSHLIGNEEVNGRLRKLLANGRLPNSMLFSGPDGVGKKQFALELARALVCKTPNDGEACGECTACFRVGKFAFPEPTDKTKDQFKKLFFGKHLDVGIVVAYRRLILVDAIRDLESAASFRPYEADARVFIIDEAEKMNDSAANALLKTLEEPAATSYIILITSRPNSLLPTIRSRCQTIRFAPVGKEDIESFLINRGSHSVEDARVAAAFSNGSISNAITFDIGGFRAMRQLMLGVIEHAFRAGNRASLIQASEQLNDAKNKDNFEANLEILESLVRDIWLLKNGADHTIVSNLDIADQLSTYADAVSAQKLSACLIEIESLRQSLEVNINKRIATDALLIKMATV